MATLRPTVKTKLKTGMYIVYIRVVHNRQSSFIRTSWMVNDKGIKGKWKSRASLTPEGKATMTP